MLARDPAQTTNAGRGSRMRGTDPVSGTFVRDTLAMGVFVRDFAELAPPFGVMLEIRQRTTLRRLAFVPGAVILAVLLGALFFSSSSLSARRQVAETVGVPTAAVGGEACH